MRVTASAAGRGILRTGDGLIAHRRIHRFVLTIAVASVAAVLAGIHHGISNRCEPMPMTAEGAEIEYQVTVPVRWPQALDAFDAARVLPKYLGREYCTLFSQCRREEEANYNAEIPSKDFEWYLRAV